MYMLNRELIQPDIWLSNMICELKQPEIRLSNMFGSMLTTVSLVCLTLALHTI